MPKWDKRYRLLLFNIFTTVVSQHSHVFPVVHFSYFDCNTCASNCPTNNIYQISVASRPKCDRCACFDKSVTFLNDFKSNHPEDVPFLLATPSVPRLGESAEFTCIRWLTNQAGTNHSRNYLRREEDYSLPDLQQQQWYVSRGAGFTLVITNVTFTVDASTMTDNLQCFNYDPDEKAAGSGLEHDWIWLFPFRMTPPVVKGPKAVGPGEEVTWTCTVDFVTIPTSTEADVDFSLEIINAGYLHVTLKGPILTDVTQEEVKGKRMVMTLTMTVPPRLLTKVFGVLCTVSHRLFGVTYRSSPMRVQVPESSVVKRIGPTLTTCGAVLGSLGILMISVSVCSHFIMSRLKHPLLDCGQENENEQEQEEEYGEPSAPASSAAPKADVVETVKQETEGVDPAAGTSPPAAVQGKDLVAPRMDAAVPNEGSSVDMQPNSPASQPGSTPASTPGSTTPASTPGSTSASTPGSTPASTPGSTAASTPGSTPASTPGSTPASTPGSTAASTPASKPASTPTSTPTAAPESIPKSK